MLQQRQVNFETAPAAAAEQEGLRPRARSSVLEAGAQPHGVAAHANSYLRRVAADATYMVTGELCSWAHFILAKILVLAGGVILSAPAVPASTRISAG